MSCRRCVGCRLKYETRNMKVVPNTLRGLSKRFTNGSVLSRKELIELHERVVKRVRKMTPKEGFKSLIASGIYNRDGKLAKEYGG